MGGPVEPDRCSNEPQPLRVITPDCTGGENKEFPPQTVNKGNSSPGHKLNLGPQSPVIGAIALHDTTDLTPQSSYNDSQNILSPTDISESRTNDRGANLNTQNDEGIPVPTGIEVQGPTHATVDKSCSTQNITIQPDLTDEQQPSHLHPSPVSCITYTPTCVESLRGLHPNEPPQAVGDSDDIRGAGCVDPPSILATSQISCVPSQQPVMSENTNNCYNESQMSVKGLQQKRKTAKKPQGARAKKQDSDGVGAGTDNPSSLLSLRGAVSSDDTNPIIPQDDEGASLNDQLLKSKEKLLSTKERKLKDLEKKLHLKEINMSDQLEQNEYSKTYILTMEHKLKELENTNRLLKMKMLCQEEMGSMGGKHKESDTEIHLPHRTTDTPSPHTDSELHARVAHMEIRLLEHRINTLEQNLWSRQNQPSYTHAQYGAVYGPPSNVYGPLSTQCPPFHSYPVGYHYPPHNWYGPYWHQNTYPPINTFQPIRHTTWPETRSNVRSATGTLPCTDNEKPQYSTQGYQMEQTVPKRAQPSGITRNTSPHAEMPIPRQAGQSTLGKSLPDHCCKSKDSQVEVLDEQPIPVHFFLPRQEENDPSQRRGGPLACQKASEGKSKAALMADHSQVPESPRTLPGGGGAAEVPNLGKTRNDRGSEKGAVPFCGENGNSSLPASETSRATVNPDRDGNSGGGGARYRGGYRAGSPTGPISLVTLNVKNMKTNMTYLQSLAKTHPIILLQEHWLYAFETTLAQQVYGNSNYHIKCVDDIDPLPPTQAPRGRTGTAILWNKSLNHCISPLPDGSDRVIAIEIKSKPRNICLINVYLPSRGTADCDIAFQAALDEIHEIIEKYTPSHKILLGGDFNSSVHRQKSCRRDRLLISFLEEHGLSLPDEYPIGPTYMHETTCANSQIDYWFVHPAEKESAAIGSQSHENLSDHVEVVLHTDIIPINILGGNPEGNILTHSSKDHIKPKVRWDKCDLQLYSDILQVGLQKIEANGPSTLLEIDLSAMALNKLLYDASVTSTPKKSNGAQKRSRLPVWNDTIAVAVKLSKLAHTEWKEAGSPTIATDLLLIKKKAARRAMWQTIRQQNYLQMQEKYTELMLAKEMDTKIFYKLVNQQRSTKNTATEVLHFEDQTFSSTEGIASAFSDHFQKLATPAESEVFDENYTNQVTFDKLLMESMAAEQPRND